MPKGGYRPGAGRPPGARTVKMPAPTTATAETAETGAMTPLDYLLTIVRDPAEPTEVRLRAAGMALPFVHTKPAAPTSKDKRQAEAEHAERGTDWERLLSPTDLYAPRRVKPFGSG